MEAYHMGWWEEVELQVGIKNRTFTELQMGYGDVKHGISRFVFFAGN